MRRLIVLMAIMLFAMGTRSQDATTSPEAYSAVARVTGGTAGGSTLQFDFRINRYTSDDEIDHLAQLLKDKGTDGLRRELEKEDLGTIKPVAGLGNQIAVARKRKTSSGTVITMFTARNMPFIEVARGARSTDYPFGLLQVKLNDKGEGEGQILVAAKIRFDKKKGHYEIESFGNQYIKVVNIRPSK